MSEWHYAMLAKDTQAACKHARRGSRNNKAAVAQQSIWTFISYMSAGLIHPNAVLYLRGKLFPCSGFSV